MRDLRASIRQLWEKVDRRAKKDQVRALEIRLGMLEIEFAKIKKELADAKH